MFRRTLPAGACALVLGLLLGASTANARPRAAETLGPAATSIDAVERDLPSIAAAARKAGVAYRPAEQMIADGELLLRLRDYSRAVLVFSQIQEKYPDNKPAFAEAVFRSGEALYLLRDYLSARTKFRLVADRAKEPEFRAYASRAVGRLVDIAMRVDDPKDHKTADDVLARIASLPASDVDSTIRYAKGKVQFFRGDLEDAKLSLNSVGADGGYQHQARYILGVIALRQSKPGKYATVIESFRKVTELPADTDEHKHVVDLAWIAVGRLFYETDDLTQAIAAYQHVDRTSKQFDTMLYEIAWVYVRQEDQDRASRALELLSLSNPDSSYAFEGELLKADILLRKAEYKKALEAYEKVRDQLGPLRDRIDGYLASGKTPADYYAKLTGASLDALDGPDSLPPVVIKLAKEQQDGALAFSVVESVQQTKELLAQAQSMLDRLQAVAASSAVKVFPDLRVAYEKVFGLLNRLAVARATLGEGLDDVEPSDLGGYPDISAVREQRRRLQKIVLGLPVDDEGFAKRQEEAVAQWRLVSQALQQRQIEIDMVQAQVNALRRYLKTRKTDKGAPIEPSRLADYQRQLEETERELDAYRKESVELKKLVEAGKASIGIGDARFVADTETRNSYRDLLEREVSLVAAQLSGEARSFATAATPVLARIRSVELRVLEQKGTFDSELSKRTTGFKAQLDAEQAALNAYREQLAKFDDEAKNVVGEVAKRNLGLVRDKLNGLVMRAEVGIVDQAWNEREVRKLILRARRNDLREQERLLDEELKQILNDGVVE